MINSCPHCVFAWYNVRFVDCVTYQCSFRFFCGNCWRIFILSRYFPCYYCIRNSQSKAYSHMWSPWTRHDAMIFLSQLQVTLMSHRCVRHHEGSLACWGAWVTRLVPPPLPALPSWRQTIHVAWFIQRKIKFYTHILFWISAVRALGLSARLIRIWCGGFPIDLCNWQFYDHDGANLGNASHGFSSICSCLVTVYPQRLRGPLFCLHYFIVQTVYRYVVPGTSSCSTNDIR